MWMLLTASNWSNSWTVFTSFVGLSLLLAQGERFSFQGEWASINSLQLILIVNFSMSYAGQKWVRKGEKENRREMGEEVCKNGGKVKMKGRVEEENVLGVREFNATAEMGQESKRETARNRGFDQRVSNITNIHEKISSLLGMIRRDKIGESVENQLERTYNQAHLQRNDVVVNFSKDDACPQRERYQPKENLSYAELKSKKYELSTRYANLQPKPAPRNYNIPIPRDYNHPISKKPKEEPVKEVKKDKPRRRYLPQEDIPRNTYKREKSAINTSRYPIQESFQETSRYDIKIQRKNECKTPNSRTRYLQQTTSFPAKQNHKASPAPESKFQKIVVDSPIDRVISNQSIHQIYQIDEQDSFVLESHIPKPQYSQFLLITQLPSISPKLNTTTLMIDQQLRRIRCKIEESQSQGHRMQKPSPRMP